MNPKGIDLSHWQTVTSFHGLAASGIQFVYAKATQGSRYVDPTFADYRSRSAEVQIRFGAYHFLTPGDPPADQATNFYNVYQRYGAGDLPMAVDVESQPGWDGISMKDRVALLSSFLNAVTNLIRIPNSAKSVLPLIYCSPGWWAQYFGAADFSGHPLWVAEYGVESPTVPAPWETWTCWQYADNGTSSSVEGTANLDMDQWNGSLP